MIEKHTSARVRKITLYWKDGKMLMRLPSERELCYRACPSFSVKAKGLCVIA